MANITSEGEAMSLLEQLKPYQEELERIHFYMHQITTMFKDDRERRLTNEELKELFKQKKNGKE